MRRAYGFRGLWTILFLVLAGLPLLSAKGADKTAKKTAGPFSGTVVDDADKPVPGATVWVLGVKDADANSSIPFGKNNYAILAETKADAQGKFSMAEIPWESTADRPRQPVLIARDAQGHFGGQVRYWRTASSSAQAYTDLQIRIPDAKDYKGQLLDGAGKPIANAAVQFLSWGQQNQAEQCYTSIVLPANMQGDYVVRTAADGSFALPHIPTVGRLAVRMEADGFGTPYASIDLERPSVPLQIERVGKIRGTLTCAKDQQAAEGTVLRLHVRYPRGTDPRAVRVIPCQVYYTDTCTVQKDGAFQFDDVLPGTGALTGELPKDSHYYLEGIKPVDIKTGETATVQLTMQPAIRLEGKIVDAQTGAGLPDINISFYYQDGQGAGGQTAQQKSDAEGKFTLYARPGKMQLNVWPIPEGYVRWRGAAIEVKEGATLEPVRLERAAGVTGIVVDKAGKPVANATISAYPLDSNNFVDQMNENLRSDAAGKFTVTAVRRKEKYSIRARTDKAVAEPTTVVVGETPEPVRLVVDEKNAFAVRGAVVDETGKALPQAEIQTTVNITFGSWGIGTRMAAVKADKAGKFEIGGLSAGDKYSVVVSAQGYDKCGTQKIEGTVGSVHDFGTLTLHSTQGKIIGTVVDSAGKPLAGVRVFNAGDAPLPVETTTDDAGRFELKGLRNGPAFVFADKAGCRFTGMRAKCGDAGITVKMLRSDEPLPQAKAAASVPDTAAEGKAAKELLQYLMAHGSKSSRNWARSRIPLLLHKKSGQESIMTSKNPTSPEALRKAAEDDLDEALSLLPKNDRQAYETLRGWARDFAASDPDKSMRCAAEAVVRARNADQPDRALKIAQMGALLVQLGHTDAGRKLALEAADMAAKWDVTDQNRYTIGRIAQAVGSCDVDRALALLQKFPDKNLRSQFLANIAASLDDIPRAEKLFKDMEPWYVARARMRLACRIAAKRPAEALRLIEGMSNDYSGGRERAKALGWLAVALAPTDQKQACTLVDRALAEYQALASRRSYMNGYEAGHPAVLAFQAKQFGYPDMESLIYRVLALRLSNAAEDDPVRVLESNVAIAMFLALADPAASRQILKGMETDSNVIGTGYSGVSRDVWFRAWALADPQHAVELLKHGFENAKDKKEKDRLQSDARQVVELWLTPAADRLDKLVQYREMLPPKDED